MICGKFFEYLFCGKKKRFTFALTFDYKCLSGGIGRRARLKLVFLGVWVRFPPQVQKNLIENQLGFFFFNIFSFS